MNANDVSKSGKSNWFLRSVAVLAAVVGVTVTFAAGVQHPDAQEVLSQGWTACKVANELFVDAFIDYNSRYHDRCTAHALRHLQRTGEWYGVRWAEERINGEPSALVRQGEIYNLRLRAYGAAATYLKYGEDASGVQKPLVFGYMLDTVQHNAEDNGAPIVSESQDRVLRFTRLLLYTGKPGVEQFAYFLRESGMPTEDEIYQAAVLTCPHRNNPNSGIPGEFYWGLDEFCQPTAESSVGVRCPAAARQYGYDAVIEQNIAYCRTMIDNTYIGMYHAALRRLAVDARTN